MRQSVSKDRMTQSPIREYLPIERGVESCDLVDAHWRHLEELGDIVHDADARPSFVLSLSEVEEGYHGCLLVLGRVVRDDLLCSLHVVCIEFEGHLLQQSKTSGSITL